MNRIVAIGAVLAAAAGAQAGVLTHTFDLSGLTANSTSFFGSFPTLQHNFGVAGEIVFVDLDLNFTSHDPSWRSEEVVFLDGAFDGLGDFIAWSAEDYGAPDSPGAFQYDDSFATSVVSDGVVSVTLTESFDDGSVNPDRTYGAGSFITVHFAPVPAPGALALLGLGGAMVARRRR